MKCHVGIAAAGGGYEVSYVELGTLLPGMGQAVKTTERISDKKTVLLVPRGNKRGEGEEENVKERGCGGATQVAIFLRKDVDIHHFHPHHNHEGSETKNNNAAVEPPLDVSMSLKGLKGLKLGGDVNDINDGCLNDTHIPHSQSQSKPLSAAQTHLYWQWGRTTSSCSSSQRKDAQQLLQIQSQLGHTNAPAMEKKRPCREDID